MKFQNMNELKLWLYINKIYNIGAGSQGECYLIGDKVYKIFNQFIYDDGFFTPSVEYSSEDILKFGFINNDTYVWPLDVILVGDIVVGYTMNYVKAKPLHKINPLLISLNKFEQSINKVEKDIKTISDNGVLSYDVCYNVMYGRNGFKIIDTLEYEMSDKDRSDICIHNSSNFAYEVKMFLVDAYFDNVIFNSKLLKKMYVDYDVNVIEFLKMFRKRLNEIEGKEISRLCEAEKSICCRRKRVHEYVRILQ